MIAENLNLVFRADVGSGIGTGHVMRCLALAQICVDAGRKSAFVINNSVPQISVRLKQEGIEVVSISPNHEEMDDVQFTLEIADKFDAKWIVLDGYRFSESYQQKIKQAGKKLLVVDDFGHASRYFADIILNPTIYADSKLYPSTEPGVKMLLGNKYALLRREFRKWRGWKRVIEPAVNRVLITLGGGNQSVHMEKAIRAIQDMYFDDLQFVVVSGMTPMPETLPFTNSLKKSPIRIAKNVSDMSDLMAWADLSIAAAGSTLSELAFMGLPSLVMSLVENQLKVAEGMCNSKAAFNLGWHQHVSQECITLGLKKMIADFTYREQMSQNGQKLIDGQGCERVIKEMDDTNKNDSYQGLLTIRSVKPDDLMLTWNWANDPVVRQNSFQKNPIPLDDHRNWFTKMLNSSNTRFWIFEMDQSPIGIIRYDKCASYDAEVHFSISHESRGKGFGKKILEFTYSRACKELRVTRIKGVVLDSNIASQRAFIKVGYVCAENYLHAGEKCKLFVRDQVDIFA